MRFELPAEKTRVYSCRLPIRWGDMDAMGHVNNAVYFTYLESARVDWLQSIGGSPDPSGLGPVIVNAFCSFIRQVEYPGELIATLYIGAVGRSSFDTYLTLARSDAPELICAEGGATIVWVDFPTGKSTPLPEFIRRHLGG